MKYSVHSGMVELTGTDDFELEKIFECGQCFRWNRDENGDYVGVAFGKAARLRKENGSVFIWCDEADFDSVWYQYFDLGRNYEALRKNLCIDGYMKKASDFGAGIRILNQEKWEGLCSFIISQCNNIPRIKQIIETFCRQFGNAIEFEGSTYYTFPSASVTASLTADDLAPLRCGYRAPYIIGAAQAVSAGSLDLDALAEADFSVALRELKKQNGIGDKVANCAILFALHKLDAFPVDVWMKKAIAEHYPGGLDPKIFGEYAGLAQQYMFYYQRSGK